MLMSLRWLLLFLLTICGSRGLAQSVHEPLHQLLPPPELLLQHRAELGLRDDQVEQIRERVAMAGRQGADAQQRLQQASTDLQQLLSADAVEEQATLAQLDKLLAVEEQQKRLHLRLMIQVRNLLTPGQRQAAAKLTRDVGDRGPLEQRLHGKLVRIEEAVQARAQAGQPPLEAVKLMRAFPQRMQRGQVIQAEALLDHVSRLLGLDEASDPPTPSKDSSKEESDPESAAALRQLVPEQRYSPAAIRSHVAALEKKDVAWRKIAWKTCLLDGLEQSRAEHKPILLWIFIDRPMDDERC